MDVARMCMHTLILEKKTHQKPKPKLNQTKPKQQQQQQQKL